MHRAWLDSFEHTTLARLRTHHCSSSGRTPTIIWASAHRVQVTPSGQCASSTTRFARATPWLPGEFMMCLGARPPNSLRAALRVLGSLRARCCRAGFAQRALRRQPQCIMTEGVRFAEDVLLRLPSHAAGCHPPWGDGCSTRCLRSSKRRATRADDRRTLPAGSKHSGTDAIARGILRFPQATRGPRGRSDWGYPSRPIAPPAN